MSPVEDGRDLIRRFLAAKYGPGNVPDALVDETIRAVAHQFMGPALDQAAAEPDGLSDEELAGALEDVARDTRLAELRRARLVSVASRRGWSLRDIGPLLGKSHGTVANILKGQDGEG